jgi:dipeptidase D
VKVKQVIIMMYDEAFVFDMQQIVNEIKAELKNNGTNFRGVF